jgi:hypothetical protein
MSDMLLVAIKDTRKKMNIYLLLHPRGKRQTPGPWSPLASTGVHWSPLESSGVRWSPVESVGVQWSPLKFSKILMISLKVYYRSSNTIVYWIFLMNSM